MKNENGKISWGWLIVLLLVGAFLLYAAYGIMSIMSGFGHVR